MIWHQIHLIRPWWLLALIPLLILLFTLRHYFLQRNNWLQVCDPNLINYLLQGKQGSHMSSLLWLGLIWILMVFALAGPSWKKLEVPLIKNQKAAIILFDNSYMMDASDLPPTRLVHARYKLLDLLKLDKQGRFGLIAYAGEPYVVTPLTDDDNTIANLVPQLSPSIMPVDGNNLTAALKLAAQLLQQAGEKKGSIFVITGNNASPKAITTAHQLAQKGYRTFVLSVGTDHGGPVLLPNGSYLQDKHGAIKIAKLNHTTLQQLATAGNGAYQGFTKTNIDVKKLLAAAKIRVKKNETKETKETTMQWQDEGRWLFIGILPLLLLAFRRGWLAELLP